EGPALRLGLRYARGLREEVAQALVRERNSAPFVSIHDLVHRVPELRKDELNTLAEIGALNSIGISQRQGSNSEIGNRKSEIRNRQNVRVAGGVIARQRPGTAKGFVFLSLEDETGVANAIVTPDLFQKNRLLLSSEQFLMVEGILQNQDNVISVKATRVLPLPITRAQTSSHDFY